MEKQPTYIRSVSRALHLLDAVASTGRPAPAKSLARRTGLPLPTTYHLLRTLVHEGYLARSDGGYVLGDKVGLLARAPTGPAVPPSRSHPVLEQLHDELRAAAYLSVLEDDEIRLLDVADSRVAPRVDLWVGFTDAAHATALGKAVLSSLPERRRHDYLRTHELPDLTRHTVTDRRALLRELECTDTVAVDREEYAVGTACVAVPVPTCAVSAAVAVSVPARQVHRVLARREALVRAARLIAYAAGPVPTA